MKTSARLAFGYACAGLLGGLAVYALLDLSDIRGAPSKCGRPIACGQLLHLYPGR